MMITTAARYTHGQVRLAIGERLHIFLNVASKICQEAIELSLKGGGIFL